MKDGAVTDVVVVGAGIGGAATAYELSAAGPAEALTLHG